MSKMEELLDRIRGVLAGADQSNTPQLRKLAETYAEACRAVNAELAVCRELLEGVETVRVTSAQDMFDAVDARFAECDR